MPPIDRPMECQECASKRSIAKRRATDGLERPRCIRRPDRDAQRDREPVRPRGAADGQVRRG
eukprot:4760595-Prymnesium_polylepis.1